jgi:hypothetical protein
MVSITVIVCGIMIGEAIALLAGTLIIPSQTSNWLNKKNASLLILDVIAGIMILVALPQLHYLSFEIFLLLLAIGIATHTYRTIQYYSAEQIKFCSNLPLFIVNNLKLLGLLIIAVMSFLK